MTPSLAPARPETTRAYMLEAMTGTIIDPQGGLGAPSPPRPRRRTATCALDARGTPSPPELRRRSRQSRPAALKRREPPAARRPAGCPALLVRFPPVPQASLPQRAGRAARPARASSAQSSRGPLAQP